MEEITNPLKVAFADTYALYVKAQNYHWNVEGPMFPMYHEFFGNIYEEVGGAIDRFAEEIRAQKSYAPASFGRFNELSTIEDESLIQLLPITMVTNLFEDNNRVLASLQLARDAAPGGAHDKLHPMPTTTNDTRPNSSTGAAWAKMPDNLSCPTNMSFGHFSCACTPHNSRAAITPDSATAWVKT